MCAGNVLNVSENSNGITARLKECQTKVNLLTNTTARTAARRPVLISGTQQSRSRPSKRLPRESHFQSSVRNSKKHWRL